MNFAEKLQKNKIFLSIVIFILCLGLVFTAQAMTQASADPADNGNDLASLEPTEAGLVIGGEGITKGLGFQKNFYYLTKSNLDALKTDTGRIPDSLGGSAAWQENVLYSSYDNHGTPNYIYRAVSGLNLKTALTVLGADVSDKAVNLEAKATDGYAKVVFDAFGVDTPRIYYAPDGTGGAVVDPALAFYETKVSTSAPDADTIVPAEAGTTVKEYPLFAFGQTAADDHTGCSFVKDTIKIRLGADSPAFSLTVGDTIKTISLSDLVLLGVYDTSYSYSKNGVVYTHELKGMPLDKLLASWDITLGEGQILTMNVNDGDGAYAYTSRTIDPEEVSKCFLAYEAVGSDGSSVENDTPLRLYCPGEFGNAVLIKNVVGASAASQAEKVAYTVYNYQTKSRDSDPDLKVPHAPWDSKTFYGEVGSQVTVNAVEIPGRVATEDSQTIILDADSSNNTVIFRYGLNAGLLIAGNGLNKDIYYNPAELKALAHDSKNITRYYSGMKKGGIPSVIVGGGTDLLSLLNETGITATQGQIAIRFTASDGYVSDVKYDLTNSQFVPQGYYFPNIFNTSEEGKTAVNPMLAFYRLDYDKEGEAPAPTVPTFDNLPPLKDWEAAVDFPHPTIMVGQSIVQEFNVMNFAKMLFAVEVDAPQVLQIDWLDSGTAKTKKATLANIIIKGLESAQVKGKTYQGINLDRLLGAWSIPAAAGAQIQVLDKTNQILSTINAENKGDYLVAINISDKEIDRNNAISLVNINSGAVQELSRLNIVVPAIENTARHLSYLGSTDSIEKNYAKGDYLYGTLTVTGSAIGEEQIYTVKELEEYASNTGLGLGYENTYSALGKGDVFTKQTMSGIKLYDFLVSICKMNNSLSDDTAVVFVSRDNYKVTSTIGEIKALYNSYNAQGDSTPLAENLPVLLSYGANGKPLVGAVGAQAITYQPTAQEGYDATADNGGGPLKLTIGQNESSERNANKNAKQVVKIIIGDDIKYHQHGYEPYDDSATFTVDIYDNAKLNESGGLLKSQSFTIAQLESLANSNTAQLTGNYYATGDFYEGIDLWWLLNEQVGLPSLDGSVTFGNADNSYDDSSKTVDLAYLRNFSNDYTAYTSTQDTLTLTGVKPALAFAVNGYPLVKNSSNAGYVAENKAGKTVNNAKGPFAAALPDFAGTPSVSASNNACGGVKVYLNLSSDTHTGDIYGAYADYTLAIGGEGVKNSKTYKLNELEADASWIISAVQGEDTYKGISLLSILSDSNVGLKFDAENIIVKSATSQKFISADELRGAGSTILLAYSKNGVPLVPDASSPGYKSDNTGGPLYLVNGASGLEQVTAIEVTVKEGIWQHKEDPLYEQYLDSTIQVRGSEVAHPTTFTLAQIEEMTEGIVRDYFASGGDSNGGYEGVKLSYLLERAGVIKTGTVPSKITVIGSDGWKVTVPVNDVYNGIVSNYQNGAHRDVILAYAKDGYPLVPNDQSEGFDASAGNGYGPLRLVVENTISLWNKNVVAIVVGEDENEGEIGKKAPGGDIANSVFYLAVNDGNGDTKYYYYTKEELEALETEEAYFYNDHSVKKTVTAKGALLSTLLENLEGVTITPDMIVQYAEEDGYHAAANETVPDSYYKDTVKSLTEPTLWGGGSTKLPTRTIISYLIHEEYQNPDEFNVNDAPGEFKDADHNSGYLRAYRETGSGQDDDNIGGANATVIKYLLGVTVSKDGKLLSGGDGCIVKSVSDKNDTISVRSDITYKGLVPGMKYAVRAPQVTNANLADGESATQIITVGTGTAQTVTFKYTESPYFYVKNNTTGEVTNYTYTDLVKMSTQVPEAGIAPYGYQKPMYYRYNGVHLNSLTSGIKNISSVELIAKDGSRTNVVVADLKDYFVAYNNTQSKSSTNIPEGKRVTVSYPDAKVILPATGENITGADPTDYTPGGKDVDVAVEKAEGIVITTTTSSGGGGGGSSKPVDNDGDSDGSGSIIVPEITADKNDQVEAKVKGDQIKTAVKNAGKGSVSIEISASSTTESIVCTIPQEGMEALVKGGNASLMLNTSLANMAFDQDTLASLKDLAGDIKISMAKADRNSLSAEAKNKIGDRPVYDFSVQAGGKSVTEFGGRINISLPYELAPGENAGNIVIYYLDNNGKPQLVSNCIYNADKGVITFATKHLSAYGVGSLAYEFSDTKNHWAKDNIDFVTSRELFQGTGKNIFSPNGAMTRGMLVTVLGRFHNADPNGKAAFSDVSAGAYYAPYVAWAGEKGIVKGVGNNKFAPNANITREQLAVILDNYRSFAGLKFASSGSAVSFADSSSISPWAAAGVQSMQKAGIISGKANNIFDPKGNATRAEVSAMLQRFIKSSIGSVNQDILKADNSSKDTSRSSNKGSSNKNSSNDDSEDDVPHFTISGSKVAETVTFSLDKIEDMNLQTISYTGRNKEHNNERQSIEFKGVALADILDEAGVKSGASTIKIICSDGYVKVHNLQSLLDDAYSYADGADGESVPAMIAIKEDGDYYDAKEGSPFRLVMGQADWDSDETKDFNMQNWARNIKEIIIN